MEFDFEQVRKKRTIEKRALLMQNIHQEGFLMPRNYRNISIYDKEILELKAQGLTRKEIGAKLGFTKEQAHC